MIGGMGMPELIVVFGIAVLLFGAGKIPEIAKAVGKGIREFKKATREITSEIEDEEAAKDKSSEKKS